MVILKPAASLSEIRGVTHGYGWLPYEYFMPKANGDVLADDVWMITQEIWVDTEEFFLR
jgi:C1A family cysteine protease